MIECKLNIQLEGFKLDAKFTIPDKGITVVFGPSGSGKTTLLIKMVMTYHNVK